MLNSSGLDHNPSEKPNITRTNLKKNHNTFNILSFDIQTYTNAYGHAP